MKKPIKVGEKEFMPCRIFCIGKNYEEHIRELDSSNTPYQSKNIEYPIVFMKPITSIVSLGELISIPSHGTTLHHEAEVVVLLNGGGQNISIDDTLSYIAGVTLGLDLTLRDVQTEMKKKGQIEYKADKTGIVHAPIGKASFSTDKLVGNANELLSTLIKLKPTAAKGTYVKSIYMSSTMSPSIAIDTKIV